jgi:SAM-dependent methyltransferase
MTDSSLQEHYHQSGLAQRILAALGEAGLDIECLTRDDLELLDEFHIRGRSATRELAALATLAPDLALLDLGCGIGGPARLLAAEHGCRVTGVDLVPAYCEVAAELTRRVGLAARVDFLVGDMCRLPLADAAFDRVWSQHTQMNIADKGVLAGEVKRMLRPGGKAVFYEVCAGSGHAVHLPVPWASRPDHNHLCTPVEFRRSLTGVGLREEVWADVTAPALQWIESLAAGMALPVRPRPNLGLVMGPDAAVKSRNLGRNLREGRVVVVRGVFAA